MLPENFSGDDIMIGMKSGTRLGWVQVKSCHPDRSKTFRVDLDECQEWSKAGDNEYVVFVWLGSPSNDEPPIYWLTRRAEAGRMGVEHAPKNPENTERRFAPDIESMLFPKWKGTRVRRRWLNNWKLFDPYVSPKAAPEGAS